MSGHNTRTCPNKVIIDPRTNDSSKVEYEEEEINLSKNENNLINDIKQGQALELSPDLIIYWLQYRRPGGYSTLGKLKYCSEQGLSK